MNKPKEAIKKRLMGLAQGANAERESTKHFPNMSAGKQPSLLPSTVSHSIPSIPSIVKHMTPSAPISDPFSRVRKMFAVGKKQ